MTTGITDVEWLDAQVCKLSDENERLRAERLKLDRRIRNQRAALRKNWEIIEMRAEYKRAWYPSKLLRSILRNRLNHEQAAPGKEP